MSKKIYDQKTYILNGFFQFLIPTLGMLLLLLETDHLFVHLFEVLSTLRGLFFDFLHNYEQP